MGRKGRGAWEQGYDVVFKVDQSFQLPRVIMYCTACSVCKWIKVESARDSAKKKYKYKGNTIVED